MTHERTSRAKAPAAAERQFSLILALLTTERGLTKTDIFETVHGYADDTRDTGTAGATAAREKRFERDKAELRDLGVPVEVIDDPSAPGNNQLVRYRVPRGGFAMPAGLEFDADETALLALAAQVWREGSVSQESRRGLMKLKALGAQTRDDLIGVAPRLRARDAAFEPLSTAIEERRLVSFSYAKPGDTEAKVRRVEPLALVFADGNWLLVSYDLDRLSERMFLLSRIVSTPRQVGDVDASRYPGVTAERHAARALDELAGLAERQRATLEVREGTDAEVRLGSGTPALTASWRAVELGYTDLSLLADRLASFGGEVRVVSPPELKRLVAARLTLVVSTHSELAR
ncbi:WYL domain-containing protein [Pseudoclavibacter sp. AY1F1]|uniref:helix-turn-helix transcriptional regulator n=1 Tax=Pseudoclavibacter sp. AY1F1 TaxID=2080583 RepID=UPI000CE82387|nr:WYL domain-containing protein [Pseudoclavibacter sp. AY1F1]PPF47441.1 WYL domain-containing protein [Pseudoclavibacter sp. AY1F1]